MTIDPRAAMATQWEEATEIVRTLTQHGHTAYFAGGCVRDKLLGIPCGDIDIATSAHPEQVMQLFPKTVPVGARFGVVLVVRDTRQYEVATFREDLGYRDGRRPVAVRYAGPEEDAARRDLTINGLFYDPLQNRVLDLVEGEKDLRQGIVRAIGDPLHRFEEDKLRMMRAIRFACRFDFKIEPRTLEAIRALPEKILEVSQERIRDELVKLLTQPRAGRGLDLLHRTGLLKKILPEVAAMDGVPQPPEFHPEGDVFVHTRMMLDLLDTPAEPVLAVGVLLHDVGKPPTFVVKERIRFDNHVSVGTEMAVEICKRLRFSNEETERIAALVENHLKFMHVREMREGKLKRFLRHPDFPLHLELHRLDCLCSHGNLENYDFCRKKLEELSAEEIRPKPLLNGHDLIALGFKAGPLFSTILADVEEAQLENRIRSRAEAEELVMQKFGHHLGGRASG